MIFPFSHESPRLQTLATGYVISEAEGCIQCGICSFNCPISIDDQLHTWLGKPIEDPHCLTCGEWVERCPRGVLHFGTTGLFDEGER